MSTKISNDTIWDRTNDLSICSTALLSLCYRGPEQDYVQSLTQKKSVELHSVGRLPNTRDDGRGKTYRSHSKTRYSSTARPCLHWSPFVGCFVYEYNMPKFKFVQSSKLAEHYIKYPYDLTCKKYTNALQPNVF